MWNLRSTICFALVATLSATLLLACTGQVQGGRQTPADASGANDGASSDTDPSDEPDADDRDGRSADANSDGAGSDVDASCPGPVCDGTCCATDESCIDGSCRPACSGTRCGADNGLCCTGDEVCLNEQCVTPGERCDRTEECDVGDICEPTLGRCVSRDYIDVCKYEPPQEEFAPTRDCLWQPDGDDAEPSKSATEAAPTVANVTDDNGDGKTDERDIPEIIFPADGRETGCCNNPASIRIVSGRCNDDGSMETLGTITSPNVESSTGLAVGDLTGNGVPEIVGVTRTANGNREQGTAAWTRTSPDGSSWELLWHNKQYPTQGRHTQGGAVVSIANLDASGAPEVVVGNVALEGKSGDLYWDGLETSNGNGGVGNNAFLGPASAVADVDLDGNREVAAGNTLYDHDGTPLWTYDYQSRNSTCGGNLPCDGFTAFGDFDNDPEGEVVIVRLGEVFILNHDGSLVWKAPILKDDCNENEAGPPTVSDFDGDGSPEVGTAAADFYTVLDPECDQDPVPDKCRQRNVLWATPNEDCSSRITASSVFDFEGDGAAEMVYADEENFYILDGSDGDILFKDSRHSHNTRIEMPVVADIDNDFNSEVVVGAPYGANEGIAVWADQDDNWVRTRRIWNQHAYSVTNVEEDGTIPTKPNPNWRNERLNNFRQNQQPAGVFDAPDLITSIDVARSYCAGDRSITFDVTVENDGALGVAPGTPVRVVAEHAGSTQTLADETTSERLLPGQTESFQVSWTIPSGWLADGFTIRAVADPDNDINECKEDNNAATLDSETDLVERESPVAITDFEIDNSNCSVNQRIDVSTTLENIGDQPLASGLPVAFVADNGNNPTPMETVSTDSELAPGETTSLSFEWAVESSFFNKDFTVRAEVDPDEKVLRCEAPTDSRETRCELGG